MTSCHPSPCSSSSTSSSSSSNFSHAKGRQILLGLCETDGHADRQTDRHVDGRETPPHSFRQPGDVSASPPVCSVTSTACSGTSSLAACILLTLRQAFPVRRRPLACEDIRRATLGQVLLRFIICFVVLMRRCTIGIILHSLPSACLASATRLVTVNGLVYICVFHSADGSRGGGGGIGEAMLAGFSLLLRYAALHVGLACCIAR